MCWLLSIWPLIPHTSAWFFSLYHSVLGPRKLNFQVRITSVLFLLTCSIPPRGGTWWCRQARGKISQGWVLALGWISTSTILLRQHNSCPLNKGQVSLSFHGAVSSLCSFNLDWWWFLAVGSLWVPQFICSVVSDPMGGSTTGFPVHHQLPELTQTHLHRVGDAIQTSHPLSSLSPCFILSKHQGLLQWVSSSHQVAKVLGDSASSSVLPMNTQDWFPLGWTGLNSLQSKGLSRVFSNVRVQNLQFFSAQLALSPTLTSILDYWKNHSFD